MPEDKKKKQKKVDELRMTLDDIRVKELDPEERKCIESLEKRISKDHKKHMTFSRKIQKEKQTGESEDVDPLKPKIKIYENPNKKPLIIPPKKEIKEEITQNKQHSEINIEENIIADKNKVDEIKGPEFIEVKPKEIKKEPEFEEIEEQIEDITDQQNIKTKQIVTEWEPVEIIEGEKIEETQDITEKELEEKINEELREEIEDHKDLKKCPNCKMLIECEYVFCPECGLSINGETTKMGKSEDAPSFISIKKTENEPELESIDIVDEKIENTEEYGNDEEKIEVFRDFDSIDDKTAILLFNNGIINVDFLKEKSVKEIGKIKGINKKKAKEIKKELDGKEKKSLEVKPELIIVGSSDEDEKSDEQKIIEKDVSEEVAESFEIIPESVESDVIEKEIKEDVEEKIEITDEWEEVEKTEDKELEPESLEEDISNDLKSEIFKDFNSIDEDTAKILYDNGFVNMDTLVITSVRDFTKIGIKKRTAKHIKKEVQQKLEESTKKMEKDRIVKDGFTEYIVNDGIEEDEGKIIEEKIIEEEIKKDVHEEGDSDYTQDDFVNIFKNVNTIDYQIAKLLYENGITSVKFLKETTIHELTKIHGIRRKLAKKIKNEVKYLPVDDFSKIDTTNGMEKETTIDEENVVSKEEPEWDSLKEEKKNIDEDTKGYQHEDYLLYEKKIPIKGGNTRTVRFFSKEIPDDGKPIDLPDGYTVKINKNTGVPHIRKGK